MDPRSTCVLLTALALAPPVAAQPPAAQVMSLGGLETRTAALLLSGQEAGELDVSLLAIPMPAAGASEAGTAGLQRPSRVVLVVDVGGGPLLAGNRGDSLVSEIYAYAVDARGAVGGVLTQAFRLDLATHRDALAGGAIKFFGHLDLAPGEYSLRLLVLHRQSGRLRLRVQPVTVPGWQGPVLLPPLFPESPQGFLILHEQPEGGGIPFPRVTDGRPWVPSTRPRSSVETELYLLSHGFAGGLRAHVLPEGREEARSELGLGDLRPVADPPAGLDMLAADLKTGGLPGGRYLLQVSAAEGSLSVSTPLWVPPSEDELALRGELAAEAPAETGSEALSPYRRMRGGEVERARAAYVEALGHLVAGERSAARQAILDNERGEIGGVLGERTAPLQRRLMEAEVEAALRLVGERAAGLVPLISLHEELYRQYHRERQYLLSTHARQVLLRLSDVYIERHDSDEARRLVASAVASVAGYLQEIGTRLGAERAYQLALEYHPGDTTSLIGLAILREVGGKYQSAADLLKQLLDHAPQDRQAKVRLAVNLRRLGATRRALKLLLECVSADVRTDWVTAVAYQELSDLYVSEKRHDDAVATLQEAIERMPAQQRFYVQLAALLDRLERPVEAAAVLYRLDPQAGADDSPRLRYEQLPIAYLDRSRQILAQEAERRLPILSEAAARAAEGGRGGSEASP